MTQVLFIHSAGAQGPGEGSHSLVAGLRAALPDGFALEAPMMPRPDNPEAEPWIAAIKGALDAITGDFVLAGHSLGGSTALQVLDRFGIPSNLLGVVTLASPFWGGPDWPYAAFALPDGASERLKPLRRVIILQGDRDEVVAEDHPERYRKILPQAEIRILPDIDHGAAEAGPDLAKAITDVAAR